MLVVWIAISAPAERLYHPVRAFGPAAAGLMPCMGDNAFHVSLDEPGEPGEVPVPRAAARLGDAPHHAAHALRLPAGIGLREHVLHDAAGREQPVPLEEVPASLAAPSACGRLRPAGEPAALRDGLACTGGPVLGAPRGGAGHQDMLRALQAPGTLLASLVPEPPLPVLPGFRDRLVIEAPDQMEAVVDDRRMGMALGEGPLEVGIHVACDACGLHDVPAQAGHERGCLEGLAERQQVLHEAEERHRQAASGRLGGHAPDA